ncbi:MAG: sigma-70 family RNA polymerase sigma factor [Myxococcales bacterium]|jgi:RNA polymerase sigma-70 factor (ECF subfamily)
MSDAAEQHALVQRAKDGDVAAFERLVAPHVPRVRRFARSMCSDPADADDVAQDALVKAYLAVRSYRYQAAFSTWLYRIVRNTFIDSTRSAHARRRDRTETLEPAQEPAGGAGDRPDEQLLRARRRALLWDALRKLPTEYRTAVVLFDLEGFSQEEVAAIEEVALGTVKSRISRGRKQLRALLGEQDLLEAGNLDGSDLVEPKRSLP